MDRRLMIAAHWFLAAATLFAGSSVSAQDFPNRPIRVIVTNSPGTTSDALARVLAPAMSRFLSQPVVVENKAGAGNLIGFEYVAKQVPADGYTVALITIPSLVTLPLTVKDLRFDPLKDLPPFIGLAKSRLVLASSTSQPWKSFNDMLTYGKANPGKLNYGSADAATRILAEAILRRAGISAVNVPYKSTAPYVQAVIASEVNFALISAPQAIAAPDRIRVLAVTGDRPSAALPGVPTFAELGHPQIRGIGLSMNGPAGMPKAAIEKLSAAAAFAMEQADVKALFEKASFDIALQSADEITKGIAEESRLFADVAKQVGIQPQ